MLDWLLYTSVFAACCALGLCMATERLILVGIPNIWSPLHALVFGSTLVVYNVHYLFKRSSAVVSDRFTWSQRHRAWHICFFSAGVLMCLASLFFLSMEILGACCVLGLLSFAYSIPLLPFKEKKRIRDFGWIKITVLTMVWTIVTSVLPMLYWHKPIGDYPFEILIRFVFLIVLCIAFDIRDMQTDLDSEIFTLPNLIGVKNSYRLMDAGLLLFAVLSVIQYCRYPSATRLAAELMTIVVARLVIAYTKRYPSDRAYLALVDGLMLFYAVLVLWH